jgi:DNA polymerase III alpha subunit (gram-positive type)
MKKPKYLAMDCETGGLDATKNPVLTAFFGVIGEDYGLIDELYLFIRPDEQFSEISKEAMAVNKIDIQKHIEDPRTVSRQDAGKLLLDFLKKNKKLKPLGHNVDFDIGMVTAQLISPADWNKNVHYGKIDTKMIADFLKEVGWLPPEIGRLESLVKHFAIPQLGAHEARNDTLMAVEAYRNLVEMVASKSSDGTSFDVLSLLEK